MVNNGNVYMDREGLRKALLGRILVERQYWKGKCFDGCGSERQCWDSLGFER